MSHEAKTNPSHPRYLRDVEQWHRETDVAIVGFGGAGGCAAIEVADAGSEAIIFELASASGGSTALSSAEIYMGGSGGTRVEQACGFEDSTQDMITYMTMSADPQADEVDYDLHQENSDALLEVVSNRRLFCVGASCDHRSLLTLRTNRRQGTLR